MRITAPGRACFSSRLIRLLPAPYLDEDLQGDETMVPQGEAFIRSPRGNPKYPSGEGPNFVHLTDEPTTIKYGHFGHDGEVPVAAVRLECDNNGGTAAGQLLSSIAVYTVSSDALRLLGLITPKQQLHGSHVTLLQMGRFSSSGLTVGEAWYGPDDGDCCPTGEARSTYQYEAGSLRYVGTRVTKRPH